MVSASFLLGPLYFGRRLDVVKLSRNLYICQVIMIDSSYLITVNGDRQTCSPETTLPQFLIQLGLNSRLIAVEYNGEILHRQYWEKTQLQNGDRLEIVTIVGGG